MTTVLDRIAPSLSDTRTVMLDKERTLRMDFNALAKAEEITGKNWMTAESWKTLSAKDYRALTWACLLDEDPSLTLEQAGKLLTPRNEKEVSDALLGMYIVQGSEAIDNEKEPIKDFPNGGGGGEP